MQSAEQTGAGTRAEHQARLRLSPVGQLSKCQFRSGKQSLDLRLTLRPSDVLRCLGFPATEQFHRNRRSFPCLYNTSGKSPNQHFMLNKLHCDVVAPPLTSRVMTPQDEQRKEEKRLEFGQWLQGQRVKAGLLDSLRFS